MKYQQVIREGYASAMRADASTFIVGEGIGRRGGCFIETLGLYNEFGPERVLDMPISESAFVGMCAGAAACGSRAIANLMFLDFATVAMDQIVNQAAKFTYISAGQFRMPFTITAMYGLSSSSGAHHTQPLYPWFMYVPGVKVVMPATPYDVKGLLASAIMDDSLVMVLHHRELINLKGPVPEDDYFLELGKAEVIKEGSDVTIVAPGIMRYIALEAANQLASHKISAEVIDPRTLIPLDEQTILASVKKTGKLVVVDEGYSTCGFGAEIIAMVNDRMPVRTKIAMRRLHTLSVPTPYSPPLEKAIIPDSKKIINTVMEIM